MITYSLKNSRLVGSVMLAFLSPILLLIDAFKSKGLAYKRWALTLFITMYGSTIHLNITNDGYRHREKVYTHYMDLSFSEFFNESINILIFKFY
jgi:hypothetical protein